MRNRDWKQPYRRSRAIDSACRCHGGCPYCAENRAHANRRRELAAAASEQEFADDPFALDPNYPREEDEPLFIPSDDPVEGDPFYNDYLDWLDCGYTRHDPSFAYYEFPWS